LHKQFFISDLEWLVMTSPLIAGLLCGARGCRLAEERAGCCHRCCSASCQNRDGRWSAHGLAVASLIAASAAVRSGRGRSAARLAANWALTAARMHLGNRVVQ